MKLSDKVDNIENIVQDKLRSMGHSVVKSTTKLDGWVNREMYRMSYYIRVRCMVPFKIKDVDGFQFAQYREDNTFDNFRMKNLYYTKVLFSSDTINIFDGAEELAIDRIIKDTLTRIKHYYGLPFFKIMQSIPDKILVINSDIDREEIHREDTY